MKKKCDSKLKLDWNSSTLGPSLPNIFVICHKVEDSSHFGPTLAAVHFRVPGITVRINFYATQKFL